MLDDYEIYQGVVLRTIIVGAATDISISPFRAAGRVNAYAVNNSIGVYVKHSSRRMSPWRFTFHLDQVSEIKDLESAYRETFIAFVCGKDGIATIDVGTTLDLLAIGPEKQAWIRIGRRPHSLYEVTGNRSSMSRRVPHGTPLLNAALQRPTGEIESGNEA